ncbi:MAG: hypothetical protein KGK01_13500 [Bradyrhizobium sp.]|uniref:hypothetical protein n=1 Tax=Bradyrhizobium sp. TaxID=376 RepID=UPI001C298CAD|nr:hypothetical protein [Bradyrhizobium sp.]MBU6463001.1 hypothetical protein [Pseudomonadota bacterium]MDE2066750.1 hypothetical protein [Bradyrhizobium sp.]MDE2243401.1 hypothetical protein [Bradyrhizobium sp.]
MSYQQQIEYLVTVSATIAAQLQELKALRKQVKEGQTMSADEPAVQSLMFACPKNPPA